MAALDRKRKHGQMGFSLLETLLALAIMSVASLALFQSTATLLRLSERTVNAAFKAQDLAVIQKSFATLVRGLVPVWPKNDDGVFIGTPSTFSGLTRASFHTMDVGLTQFSLSLEKNVQALEKNVQASVLVYRSDKVEWVLQELPAGEARFSYLGEDNVWQSSWPPEDTPKSGRFGDEQFYDIPAFPLAIQMKVDNAQQKTVMVWINSVGDRATLPNLEAD